MSQADIACYASKNGGRGRVTVYEPQQAAAHSERAAMSLDEQWRMIKENQLMMLAHVSLRHGSRKRVICG